MFKRHLIINIIYIPGTVAYQSLGLLSLLINSNFNFRLIGNALDEDEDEILQVISNTSSRLSYVNFESNQIIPHGTLLDILFLSEKRKYFCFCDSDIFLFEQLTKKDLINKIGHKHVFSSGGRIENEDDAVYAGFRGGATTKSPDGHIDLATSFFCVYERKPLETIINSYKVGFEQYRMDTQIPEEAMNVIKNLNLSYDMFDTGKLLSVLLHHEGYEKAFEEINGLVHIGGMSGRYLQNMDLSKQTIFNDEYLESESRDQNKEFHIRNEYEISLKKFYGRYYYCFLNHLINNGAMPINKSTNQRIRKTIKRLNDHLTNIINQVKKDPKLKTILNVILK